MRAEFWRESGVLSWIVMVGMELQGIWKEIGMCHYFNEDTSASSFLLYGYGFYERKLQKFFCFRKGSGVLN
jgi:hypothetical protein